MLDGEKGQIVGFKNAEGGRPSTEAAPGSLQNSSVPAVALSQYAYVSSEIPNFRLQISSKYTSLKERCCVQGEAERSKAR